MTFDKQRQGNRGHGIGLSASHSGPPVGLAFATFTAVSVALPVLGFVELNGDYEPPDGAAAQFGIVATTTFAIAGLLAIYRALSVANRWAWAVAAVLIGPGAVWSWSTFVVGAGSRLITLTMVLAAGILSVVLLIKGLRLAHWLEVFAGLGSCGLVVAGTMVQLEPLAADSMSIALLAAVSGMACLYGLLVDLEMADRRSLVELTSSRDRIEVEVLRLEDLLHDLRSGLLAIEAAIGSFDDELAAPLRAEAARLRRLTLTGARTVTDFDLVDRVENLVASRRAATADVSFDGPATAMVWGEESEILAIAENLLTNAERHGRDGPIEVAVEVDGGIVRLSVSNRGELTVDDPEAVFRRGYSTHPDGEGLGLARARMLADINGGELQLGPAEPGHTRFVVSLKSPPSARHSLPAVSEVAGPSTELAAAS